MVPLLASLLLPAYAQDDLAEFAAADQETEAVEEADTDLSAELGGAFVTGNAVYYSVNASLAFAHQWTMNKIAINGGANYSSGKVDADGDGLLSDAERSLANQELARKFFADLRYDRYLTEKDALYAWVGALHDPYAGYSARLHEQLGYARTLLESDTTNLNAEVGVDWAEEFFTEAQAEGTDFLETSATYENVLAGRVGVNFSHDFSDSVSLSDNAEVYVSLVSPADTRVLNTVALTSKLSDNFSVKLSNQITFDNVPVEGFRSLDQTTMATLVASIF